MEMKLGVLAVVSAAALFAAKPQSATVIETESARITVSTKSVGKFSAGCDPSAAVVYIRVESKGPGPVALDLSRFFLKTDDGKALPWLTPEETQTLLIGKTAILTTATAGPFMGGAMQQSMKASLTERTLSSGPVPPKAYREGQVFFRGSGDKHSKPSTLFLGGLSPDAVPLHW
jgi:hypothetical protein